MSDRLNDDLDPRDARTLGQDADDDWRDDDTAIIEADIRETRERLGDTVEEIGERLNPRRLKAQIQRDIRDATIGRVEDMAQRTAERRSSARGSMMDAVRENPIPATMAGIGLGWLMWSWWRRPTGDGSDRQYEDYRYRGGYRSSEYGPGDSQMSFGDYGDEDMDQSDGTLDRIRDRAEDVAGSVKSSASHLVDRTQQMAGQVADQTSQQARRLEDQFFENPMVIGAATLALGLVAGLSLPATRKEAELVGGARDQLVDRMRGVASRTKDKVEQVAERAMEGAQTAAKQAAHDTGLTS